MFDELRWLFGLNLVIALWLGMLADSWKGRRMYVWMAIGLVTSVAGVIALALLPKVKPVAGASQPEGAQRYSTNDSYGH